MLLGRVMPEGSAGAATDLPASTCVVIDTETTGLGHFATPPRPDAIIQVGVAWRTIEGTVRAESLLCNPGKRFLENGRADGAIRIHGRSADEVLTYPPAEIVAKRLAELLRAISIDHGCPVELRAYNVDFDRPFLASPPWSIPSSSWGPCIMEEARVAIGGPDGRRLKLGLAADVLKIPTTPGSLHDAAYDARMALLVVEALSTPPWRKT